jgi:hypothetical protein
MREKAVSVAAEAGHAWIGAMVRRKGGERREMIRPGRRHGRVLPVHAHCRISSQSDCSDSDIVVFSPVKIPNEISLSGAGQRRLILGMYSLTLCFFLTLFVVSRQWFLGHIVAMMR